MLRDNLSELPNKVAGRLWWQRLQQAFGVGKEKGTVSKLDYVDSLRALAALIVVMHHTLTNLRPEVEINRRVFSGYNLFYHGNIAVIGFLVISGFCLMHSVINNGNRLKNGLLDFYWRRIKRIYPPYLASMVIALILIYTILGQQTGTVWDSSIGLGGITKNSILLHLFMLHDIFPGTRNQINYVLWSLAVESQIYLIFPLLLWFWRRYGPATTTFLLVTPVSLVIFYLVPRLSHHHLTDLSAYFIGAFAFGMLAATIVSSNRPEIRNKFDRWNWNRICGWTTFAFFLLCIIRLFPQMDKYMPATPAGLMTAGWTAIVLIWAGICRTGRVRGWLDTPVLLWIGGFSYSLYLIHPMILQILWKYVFNPSGLDSTVPGRWLMCLTVVLSSVTVAYFFSLAFERPFLSRKRKATIH